MSREKKIPTEVEFLVSGLAAMGAITVTNPMDVVKTRMQIEKRGCGQGIFGTLKNLVLKEGTRGSSKGLTAAWALQFTNVGTRFGGYAYIKDAVGIKEGGVASWTKLLLAGGLSGALAGLVSNPFFLMKTRMQAVEGTAQAITLRATISEIYSAGGVLGFWRGCPAFIPRVAAASSVQLSTYDTTKAFISSVSSLTGFPLFFMSSWVTGLAVVLAMQPFDFSATRLMSSRDPSASVLTVLRDTVSKEGFAAIYQGTTANYLRFGPYCILVFLFAEELRAVYRDTLSE
eukprot:TRINITY_DN4661_c0_g3_i1.p1 TRINITY_DN4661_c0_g3~~TRINITY_DN4661_c0_g3_i1.p1  ORF type:complete len:303 (+),score=43.52 TRINITY_DN4661_c0_g3_i1:51-911(+)